MRLGLITDIHEHVDELRWALDMLRRERVDQFVCLGDVSEDGTAIAETCALLEEAGVIGVWGNHDYGICTGPLAEMEACFDPRAVAHMRTYKARLQIEDCVFSHIEPCLDPDSSMDLWSFPEVPPSPVRLERNWKGFAGRRFFMGHVHTWFAVSSQGPLAWNGATPLSTAGDSRYLVIVDGVCRGHCALLDTRSGELRPFTR